MTAELADRRAAVEPARLKADGLARRAADAATSVTGFIAEHGDELIAELEPEAEAIAARLSEAAQAVLAADREWAAMSQTVGALLAAMPDGSPRGDMADGHELAEVVRDIRRTLSDGQTVAVPSPHWRGRRAAENAQAASRIVQLGRNTPEAA